MTDDQLTYLYAIDRGEGGVPRIAPPDWTRPPSARQMFERRCFLLGVTEPETIAREWKKRNGSSPRR